MKKTLLAFSALVMFGVTASADWKLITDFDGNGVKPSIDDWQQSYSSGSTTTENYVVYSTDPLDSDNGVLLMVAGQEGSTSHVLPFDEEDQLVSSFHGVNKGTIFFRFMMPIVSTDLGDATGDLDLAMGMISIVKEVYVPWTKEDEEDDIPTWSNYVSIIRSLDGEMEVRDHGVLSSYLKSEEVSLTSGNVWYNFWIVHDFVSLDYKVYVQGGEATVQTLFTTSYDVAEFDSEGNPVLDADGNHIVTTAFEGDAANMRAKTNPLSAFMLRYASNEEGTYGLDDGFIDDLYVDTSGVNLESPVGGIVEGDLINIATRGLVGDSGEVMIAGFVVDGGGKSVLIQAVGAELSPGVDAEALLADPVLTLVPTATVADEDTHITVNDWEGSDIVDAGASVGATVLTEGSTSAALIADLDAGAYTVIVSGGKGIALVEVYELE